MRISQSSGRLIAYTLLGRWAPRTAMVLLAWSAGCQLPSTPWTRPACEFDIEDQRDPSQVRRYHETFGEAYFDMDGHGNVHIVLRQSGPGGDGGADLTQVVHIRTVWRSIPGRTVSHATQINATVSYFMRGGQIGDTLEGAGSILFHHNPRTDTIEGTLEHSALRAKRQLTRGEPVFPQAQLTGRFRAVRDRRRVVQIINDVERAFGPLPAHVESTR